MTRLKHQLQSKIRKCLSDELLSAKYLQLKKKKDDITFGHCYIASEAAYHLFGKFHNYKPYVMRIKKNTQTHWFLKDDKGNILDVTSKQFKTKINYDNAKCCGFLTKEPSKRAKIIIQRYATRTRR